MRLKEVYKKIGIELEVHNLITDYTLKDGRRAHIASQVIAHGTPCTDEMMIQSVRELLPEGSRICGIMEIYGEYDLDGLQKFAASFEALYAKKRPIYFDRELLKEYLREYADEL